MLATSPTVARASAPAWPPGRIDQASERSCLPGAARIMMVPPGTRLSAQIRNRRYGDVAGIVVVGPTSQAMTLHVAGPAPREVAVSARGWRRLTGVAASTIADRIVPLTAIGLDIADAGEADTQLSALLLSRPDDDVASDMVVRRLAALIEEDCSADISDVSARIGVTPSVLRRVALRSFGFPPKMLLMRHRFLTALARYEAAGADLRVVTDFGYFDSSHFLRDAGRFLGTTPRRYLHRINAAAARCGGSDAGDTTWSRTRT